MPLHRAISRAASTRVFAAGVLSAALHAGATTITFDDLAEGTTLSNQYASLGVVFSPNAFTGTNSSSRPWATNTGMTVSAADLGDLGSPGLVSGKLLHSFGDWLDEDGDPSMLATFSGPISSISADFAGIFTGLDVSLTAYDGDSIVAVITAAACTALCQQRLTISAPSITKVAFAPGSFFDWVGIDNITFTAATPVPEPGSLLLVGLALAGLHACSVRRR